MPPNLLPKGKLAVKNDEQWAEYCMKTGQLQSSATETTYRRFRSGHFGKILSLKLVPSTFPFTWLNCCSTPAGEVWILPANLNCSRSEFPSIYATLFFILFLADISNHSLKELANMLTCCANVVKLPRWQRMSFLHRFANKTNVHNSTGDRVAAYPDGLAAVEG